jgi:hypothetical protein
MRIGAARFTALFLFIRGFIRGADSVHSRTPVLLSFSIKAAVDDRYGEVARAGKNARAVTATSSGRN